MAIKYYLSATNSPQTGSTHYPGYLEMRPGRIPFKTFQSSTFHLTPSLAASDFLPHYWPPPYSPPFKKKDHCNFNLHPLDTSKTAAIYWESAGH